MSKYLVAVAFDKTRFVIEEGDNSPCDCKRAGITTHSYRYHYHEMAQAFANNPADRYWIKVYNADEFLVVVDEKTNLNSQEADWWANKIMTEGGYHLIVSNGKNEVVMDAGVAENG